MAELDGAGNVNVSRFGARLAGAGGFINISQNARRVVFTGTLTAGGLAFEAGEGRARILQEGRMRKCMEAVGQITFSGQEAALQHKPVLYVTERCVFELTPGGVALVEVAPGIDLEAEVLSQLDFRPVLGDIAEMDARIFTDAPMDLRTELLHLDLADRIALDEAGKTLFINFEKLRVRGAADIEAIRDRVEEVCGPLERRVDVVVNYDGTRIDEEIEHTYVEMVQALEERFYGTVTRYSGSAFMRRKLGQAFSRAHAAHVFETSEEARRYLERGAD
jgi:propionate CoA-transferase